MTPRSNLRPDAVTATVASSSTETDWTSLGQHFGRALGVVARERLDLHSDGAYGEALRTVAEAGHLVTVEAERAAVARSDRIAEGNRVLVEMAHRDHLAAVSELRLTMDRQVADRMTGLADELRAKVRHEKLCHQVRRGVLLAADWLAPPAARLAKTEELREART